MMIAFKQLHAWIFISILCPDKDFSFLLYSTEYSPAKKNLKIYILSKIHNISLLNNCDTIAKLASFVVIATAVGGVIRLRFSPSFLAAF